MSKSAATKGAKDHDYLFKFVLVGDSGVGKSSLLLDEFSDSYNSTIGIDFKIVQVKVDDAIVKLQVWDTAGQERYQSIAQAFYRNANAIILVYDITVKESFEHVEKWLEKIEENAPPSIPKILIGNKADLASKRAVNEIEVKEFADKLGVAHFETSAKTDKKFEEILAVLSRQVIKQKQDMPVFSNAELVAKEAEAKHESNSNNCC
eukprot:TRINITY_DN15187_c0_g2_i1.p1 TRINITY_DN15187_c0_g2~~TRINITY_DN15187_c0_g2_i1.p1  ORF type:complete len:206 (-),score=67.68 TRINITY_DN15187_c0_g2_i1:241-858(-)